MSVCMRMYCMRGCTGAVYDYLLHGLVVIPCKCLRMSLCPYTYIFFFFYIYLYVSKCLVLSVVVPVHFICFTVGEWETFLSIPCMSDMQEIDNKATLTLMRGFP